MSGVILSVHWLRRNYVQADVSHVWQPELPHVTEIRMDSFPAGQDKPSQAKRYALRSSTAVLSARRPLLVVAMSDGRVYVYRAAIRRPLDRTSSKELAFQRMPLDWLKYVLPAVS